MNNKIFYATSCNTENDNWNLSDPTFKGSLVSWKEFLEINYNSVCKEKLDLLIRKNAKIIREDGSYYFLIPDDKDYLEYCLKFDAFFVFPQ